MKRMMIEEINDSLGSLNLSATGCLGKYISKLLTISQSLIL